LSAEQYSIVWSRGGKNGSLPEFMEYAATCCDTQDHIDEFVDHLRTLPKEASGAVLVKRRSGRSVAYL
jgi:hypothetical protein